MALGQAPALAATINVGGSCTLVNAITAANNNAATGGCTAGSGADKIVLPASSTQTLTSVNNTYNGATGLPVVSSVITIAGNGSTIRRDPDAPEFRVFAVSSNGNLILQRTTVSGGISFDFGGGLASYGALTLTNSTISNNSATGAGGGGVFDASGGGPLSVTNSTITGNSGSQGGGILCSGGTITNSTISGNLAEGGGGGLFSNGTSSVTNSTISGNTSISGAVANFGTLTLTNTTISGNTASNVGGGGVRNSGTLTLNRTLISGNSATGGPPELYNRATVIANNFNVFGKNGDVGTSNFSPGATDIVAKQSLSGILVTTLANNGGPTQTHALVTGSPAVDAVSAAGCPPPETDQRGVERPQNATCDIGAFELELAQPGTVQFRRTNI